LPTDAAQINMTAVATFAGAVGPAGCDTTQIGEAGIWTNATAGPQYGDAREGGNKQEKVATTCLQETHLEQ